MSRQYVSLALLLFIFLPIKLAIANALEVTPTLYFFNYQEFDQNDVLLDKEQGVLPGIKLSYADVTERDTLKFNASLYGGRVDYDGQTQSGIPHQTETDEQLFKLGISYFQHRVIHFPGLFFAGLHYWYWDRDIQTRNNILAGGPVQGLHELYSWYETELGLKFISDSSYWLELSVMYNFNPKMELFLPSGDVAFKLKSRPGYRIRAGKTWANNASMTTNISLFAEYWEFGRSEPVSVADFFGSPNDLFEPDSETFNSGLEFSFIYKF